MARKRGGRRPARAKARADKAAKTATPKEEAIEVEGRSSSPFRTRCFASNSRTGTKCSLTCRERSG